MDAVSAIEYIEKYTWSSTKLGLDRTIELLDKMGNPQDKLKFVHVAGTNGKGSTCAMLSSILEKSGYTVGLYTSPYILKFNERMQVNGNEISDEKLAQITSEVIPLAESMEDHPSQFELVTAIAMQYFLDSKCDIVVLEVGLGGELDSTNVIKNPECSVICNMGLEHTEYLGNTLSEIAKAKAGIIKKSRPVVCYKSDDEALNVFEEFAKRLECSMKVADFSSIELLSNSLEGQFFNYKSYNNLRISLLGMHQLRNAAVVLETVDVLKNAGWNISDNSVREGLDRAKWAARFEILSSKPAVVVDGAHNPQCAEALSEAMKSYLPGKNSTFLMGVLKDKDYNAIIDYLVPYAKSFVCVTPDSPRAMTAEELAQLLKAKGETAVACDSISQGADIAMKSGNPVVACGSLYMAGIARKELGDIISLMEEKKKLRSEVRKAERELTDDFKKISDSEVNKNLLNLDEYKNAKTVFAFVSLKREISTDIFIEDVLSSGRILCVPLCAEKGMMKIKKINSLDELHTGAYGIKEPSEDCAEIPAEDIDLALIPCVSCNSNGDRLGQGGGYYDRFLYKFTGTSVMVCREILMRENIPMERNNCDCANTLATSGA